MAVFKDPDTLIEIVTVCKTMPSGASNIKFSLLGNGPASSQASISYTWPPVMFNLEELFETPINKNTMDPAHPLC